MRDFLVNINKPYLGAILGEAITVFLAEKISYLSALGNKSKILVMTEYIPLFLIMAMSAIIALTYLSDGERINNTIISLKKEYSWTKLKVSPKILQVLFSVFFIILQWGSLKINAYWGIFVQATIYFLVLARRYDNKKENLLLILRDTEKAKKFTPISFLIGFHRTKLYGFAINLIGAAVFINLAFYIGKIHDVEWRKYDLVGLYLFFIVVSSFLSLFLMIPGYYYSKKQ